MNALAEKYAGRGVQSVFLYTNEAHPGEHYPHLESFEQKLRHAHALRDEYDVSRPIVVANWRISHWACESIRSARKCNRLCRSTFQYASV